MCAPALCASTCVQKASRACRCARSVHWKYNNASHPYEPKPAFLAAAAAQRTVGAGRFLHRVRPAGVRGAPPADVFVLAFADASAPGSTDYALWTNATAAAGASLTLAVPSGACFHAVDMLGAPLGTRCAHGEALTLAVTDAPSYLLAQ